MKKKIPKSIFKIDVCNPDEVSYWCERFNCTEDELINAVNAKGTKPLTVSLAIDAGRLK